MIRQSRKISFLLFGSMAAGIAAFAVVNFSDACHLKQVRLNGAVVEDWPERWQLLPQHSLFDQPVDSLATCLLRDREVLKVEMDIKLPHTLEIHTNRFDPICFVHDPQTGEILGLNREVCLIPLDPDMVDWERPLLVGMDDCRLYQRQSHPRYTLLCDRLDRLARRHMDLFRLIEELDVTHPGHVSVRLAGLPFNLRMRVERLDEDLQRFVEFMEQFNPDLNDVRYVDLRFEEMIICAKEDA